MATLNGADLADALAMFTYSDGDELTPEQTVVVRAIIRERLKQTAEFCRETLRASRGGMHHLTENQAVQYAIVISNLDTLILDLSYQ